MNKNIPCPSREYYQLGKQTCKIGKNGVSRVSRALTKISWITKENY